MTVMLEIFFHPTEKGTFQKG